MLNPRRPPNPFTTTTEPDWIMIPASKDHRTSEGRINPPPIPPSRRGTQKVPVPHAIRPSDSGDTQASGLNQDMPASPTFTNLSRTSTASSVRRKPAPPVPKKPPLLSASSAGPDDRSVISPKDTNTNALNGHRAEDQTTRTRVDTFFPPPPRRRGTATMTPEAELPRNTVRTASSARQISEQRRRPSSAYGSTILPASRSGRDSNTGQRNLLDEDDGGAKTIPSLQPQRPV